MWFIAPLITTRRPIIILFERDWARYPSAIVNLKTTNQSFVRFAALLRDIGVSNHTFVLALVNPALVGIDPFSKSLSEVEMAAIVVESKINPWFFFREIARAPAIGSGEPAMLEANRGNIALFWCFFNHLTIILIQIRQTGKSFSTDVLMTLLMNVICENTSINLMTKDDLLRRANIERLKLIAADLPWYMNQKTREDANNGEEITIKSLGNTYKTHVPQASAKAAANMGRGLTSAIFHIDEPPFQRNIEIALKAALASTGAAVDKAKAAGTPYGTIFTTTAGKKDDTDGAYVYEIVCDAAIWTEKFLDAKNHEQLERIVRQNSRSGEFMVNATFSHRQLGKTDDWLKTKLEASRQTGDEANRDFFNMWTSGSMSHPLTTALLDRIRRSVKPDYYTNISSPHGYITRWYIPEEEIEERMANGKFVLGMDTSEASGGDDISLILVDIENLEVVAAGNYNETNLITFSEWVCSILVQFENVTAIIERRSTGAMVLDYLLLMLPVYGIDPFKRLFNKIVQDYDEMPSPWAEIRQPMGRRDSEIYTRYKKVFGFATSGTGATSRSELYSTTLQNAGKRAADKVHDRQLADQVLGLVIRNGRIDHALGKHDDLLIGWLLCHWLLTLGKNLQHYGIDVSKIMSLLADRTEETLEQQWARHDQIKVRQEITAVVLQLETETDEYVSAMLEAQLRVLDRRVVLEAGETYSLDSLIHSTREARRSKKRGQQARLYGGTPQLDPSRRREGVFSDEPLNMDDYSYR